MTVKRTESQSPEPRRRDLWVGYAESMDSAQDLRGRTAKTAETVALAIVLNFYNNHTTVDVDSAEELKG